MKWFKKKNEEVEYRKSKKDELHEIEYKNIKNYKVMMIRNDRVKIFGRMYVITNVDYHRPSLEEVFPDMWSMVYPNSYITLRLIDDMPEIKKEFTITVNEFEEYMGWDSYKNKDKED